MQDLFERFFLSKKVLYSLPIVYFVFKAASLIFMAVNDGPINSLLVIKALINLVLLIVLVVSYKKHDKNVMKGVLGASLAISMISSLDVSYDMVANKAVYDELLNNQTGFFALLSFLYAFGIILIFAIHFLINSDHHSSPTLVSSNQLLVLFTLAIGFIEVFLTFILGGFTLLTVSTALAILATICVLTSIVCIESNLDAFRIKREEKASQQQQ